MTRQRHKGTLSLRKHRFQSFNERLSKIKIEPARVKGRPGLKAADQDQRSSYFKDCLDRWRDTNLSTNFSEFVQQVASKCESLPQLLHFRGEVFEILNAHIRRCDALSAEPLLDLLANLAHDLGVYFEIHLLEAVESLKSLVTGYAQVEVIEWSFNCLAWLFKYLSRLLVPNLVPLFQVLSPLLGKTAQKHYVTRLAAESLSYLVSRAATRYPKDELPLERLLTYISDDLRSMVDEAGNVEYQQGLRILFVESLKGAERGLHSCTTDLYRCLLQKFSSQHDPRSAPLFSVLQGITIGLLHHTDVSTSAPILDIILTQIHQAVEKESVDSIRRGASLLLIIAGIRKGSRVADWASALDSLIALLETAHMNDEIALQLSRTAAVMLQYAPLNAVISRLQKILDLMQEGRLASQFIPFCILVHELGADRFCTLILPDLQRYISRWWREYQDVLLTALPTLLKDGMERKIDMPAEWQAHSVQLISSIHSHDELIPQAYALLMAWSVLKTSDPSSQTLRGVLHSSIRDTIASSSSSERLRKFVLGYGLKTYARQALQDGEVNVLWWQSIYDLAETYRTMPAYLEALVVSLRHTAVALQDHTLHVLVDACSKNLHSPSHILRKLSLEVLAIIYNQKNDPCSSVISTALAIEGTPLDLNSARKISMYIRQMTSRFLASPPLDWLHRAIAYFCYGLYTYKLSSAWAEVDSVLEEICTRRVAEDTFTNLAFEWLSNPQQSPFDDRPETNKAEKRLSMTAFQCSNIEEIYRQSSKSEQYAKESQRLLVSSFEEDHQMQLSSAIDSVSLALRFLTAVPNVAEKCSKHLVPIFLSQVSDASQEQLEGHSEKPQNSSVEIGPARFSRRDRKALLDLFSRFVNPKVLYRSSEVFDALLSLVASGDTEIQLSALKAIFTWKTPSIQPYQDFLLNLTDDSRFREEIAVLVSAHDKDKAKLDAQRDHVTPILLRILYGKMTSRTGKGASNQQIVRKKAVLQALSHFKDADIIGFLRIAMGDLFDETNQIKTGQDYEDSFLRNHAVRKRLGLVNMVKEMLTVLGSRLEPFTSVLANGVFCCLVGSTRQLLDNPSSGAETINSSQHSLLKDVRQIGLQCVNLMYRNCVTLDLDPYVPLLFDQIVDPRLRFLPMETSQSTSGMLHLFSTWSKGGSTMLLLVEPNPRLMEALGNCLGAPAVKDEVISFIIDKIWGNLVNDQVVPSISSNMAATPIQGPEEHILSSQAPSMFNAISRLLHRDTTVTIQASAIKVMVGIAPFISDGSQVEELVEVSKKLLEQPTQRVNLKIKGDLLRVLQQIIQNPHTQLTQAVVLGILEAISPLFAFFNDRENRSALADILFLLANCLHELKQVARLCASLNSYAADKVDEPDFSTRLAAFHEISDVHSVNLIGIQWLPLVHNALYFLKEQDELAIRSSAGLVLKRFVEQHRNFDEISDSYVRRLFETVLLPALRKGVSQRSELVRAEHLSVMAHTIRHNSQWIEVRDMFVLLVDDDEEASFFNNILHIQQHRRLRAMRRLAAEAQKGALSSKNAAHLFVPLLEQFVFDEEADESAHNLVAEAVVTIGALASSLEWPQYRAILRRYISFVMSKPGKEKTLIKLIGFLVDALPLPTSTMLPSGLESGQTNPTLITLSKTMPGLVKLAEDIKANIIPPLVKYLHDKDESTVSLRVLVAVAAAKLLLQLEAQERDMYLPPMLTDVTNILRSRTQESRDLTRKTLVDIAKLLGPTYFGFILKELRASLQRGYQLHVLSFTVHSLLVATSDNFHGSDLNYCLPEIVTIIMDDIFGVTGQEKDAEEYISKMKEVKSSKSFDSMEHLAKNTAVDKLFHLVRPIQELLEGKLDLGTMKKVEELLRRIMVGLSRNEDAQDRRILMFCHEVIRNTYKRAGPENEVTKELYKTKRFLTNIRASDRTNSANSATYNQKLIRFGLDVTRTVLQRRDALQTPANLSGFMPFIGDALVGVDEHAQIASARLLSTIIKLPLQDIDKNAGTYITQAVKIIRSCSSTSTELAQAALKLVSSVLRERKQVEVREMDLAYLLQRMIPDLEEPDRQGVAFNFLKAALTRKVMITEVYEVMDTIATLLVTNQSRNTRDQARGLYLQFIMTYPQGKGRYAKQLAFFIKNLDYMYEDGRRSVMEALHLLLSRLGEDLAQDLVETAFVPLVMTMVNDEVSDCREMAATLVRSLLERADDDRRRTLLTLLRSWLDKVDQPSLVRIGLQVFGLYLEAVPAQAEREIPLVLATITKFLKRSIANFHDEEWEMSYIALEAFNKICRLHSSHAFEASTSPIWVSTRRCQALPHAWIKSSAAKLIGLLFADFSRATAGQGHVDPPLKGTGGLRLAIDEMAEIIRQSLRSLQVPNMSEELANQLVKNLVFVGKYMAHTPMLIASTSAQEDEEDREADDLEMDDVADAEGDNLPVEPHRTGVQHILSHAAYLLRRGPRTTGTPSLQPLHSCLRLIALLSKTLDLNDLNPSITTILLPLHNLTDPSIPGPTSPDPSFTASYKSLVNNAQELMGFLQEKIGTSEYIKVLGEARQGVKIRREERRTKRRLEAVNEVERRQRRKVRKVERGKEKRKERGQWEQGRRRGW